MVLRMLLFFFALLGMGGHPGLNIHNPLFNGRMGH